MVLNKSVRHFCARAIYAYRRQAQIAGDAAARQRLYLQQKSRLLMQIQEQVNQHIPAMDSGTLVAVAILAATHLQDAEFHAAGTQIYVLRVADHCLAQSTTGTQSHSAASFRSLHPACIPRCATMAGRKYGTSEDIGKYVLATKSHMHRSWFPGRAELSPVPALACLLSMRSEDTSTGLNILFVPTPLGWCTVEAIPARSAQNCFCSLSS